MRNVVLAEKLAAKRGVSSAVAAYAEAFGLPTAEKARSGLVGGASDSGTKLVVPLSYQSIVALARSVSKHPEEWDDLAVWVERKIATVTTDI